MGHHEMRYSSNKSRYPCHRPMSPITRHLLVGRREHLPPKPEMEHMEVSLARSIWWPLILMLWTTPTALIIPMTVKNYGSSVLTMLQSVPILEMWREFPRPTGEAAVIILVFVIFQGLLLECLPGKVIYGPPTPAGEAPQYYDNGMKAWFITHSLWLLLGPILGVYNFARIYDIWGEIIATFHLIAIMLCLFLYWKGKNYPSSRDAVFTGRVFFDFFQGIELHPKLFDLNLKQLLNCRVSMMTWSLSYLCFAQAQYNRGELSSGMMVSVSLLFLYLAKFFWWEAGYFASIDIILDRCGYYLFWGVLVWVPSCYTAPGYVLVEHPTHWHPATAALVFLAGIGALYINYAADRQRQVTRSSKGTMKIWGRIPKVLHADYVTNDGEKRSTILLCDGFWALARHFNYVPEITLAILYTLPAGTQLLQAWIYVVFLICLLVDRSDRDDEKCRLKYGDVWTQYCREVRYKILPFVY